MLEHLETYKNLSSIINHRKGEVKLGERFRYCEKPTLEILQNLRKKGARFALLGIPESVGILANHGEAGAEKCWEHFIHQFANLQSNRFIDGTNILCLGMVKTTDLQLRAFELNQEDDQYRTKLRSLCQQLDQRVTPIVETLVKAKIVPIVIGGGHNNAFPILRAFTKGLNAIGGINCLNLDAHADFRPLEGRHSGNGFSYAFYQKDLRKYYVMGLNPSTNSEAMLKNLDLEPNVGYSFYEPGVDPDASTAIKFVAEFKTVGLEVDLDVMSFMPASAFSVNGFSLDQVRVLIKKYYYAAKTSLYSFN